MMLALAGAANIDEASLAPAAHLLLYSLVPNKPLARSGSSPGLDEPWLKILIDSFLKSATV